MKSKKGFSLFTPLVGTAIMVITIIISSTIIQNDIRFSNAITNAYVISSQTVVSRGIEADINSVAKTAMSDSMSNTLTTSPGNKYTIICEDKSECITEGMAQFESVIKDTVASDFKDVFTDAMEEVIEINSELGYDAESWDDSKEDIKRVLRDINPSNLFTYSMGDGYFFLELNSDYLLENHLQEFSLTFTSDVSQETFTIPIVPETGAVVKTKIPIIDIIKANAKIYELADDGDRKKLNSLINVETFAKVDKFLKWGRWHEPGFAGGPKVESTWEYGDGTIEIIMRSNNYMSGGNRGNFGN